MIQTDPFFSQLKVWGDTIWDLWLHNNAQEVAGIVPVEIAEASVGNDPPPSACETSAAPQNLFAIGVKRKVQLTWDPVVSADEYRVYYDQAGKHPFINDTQHTSYLDSGLKPSNEYCYVVKAWSDCGDGDESTEEISAASNTACGVPTRR